MPSVFTAPNHLTPTLTCSPAHLFLLPQSPPRHLYQPFPPASCQIVDVVCVPGLLQRVCQPVYDHFLCLLFPLLVACTGFACLLTYLPTLPFKLRFLLHYCMLYHIHLSLKVTELHLAAWASPFGSSFLRSVPKLWHAGRKGRWHVHSVIVVMAAVNHWDMFEYQAERHCRIVGSCVFLIRLWPQWDM